MDDNGSTEPLIHAETVEADPNADLTRQDDCAPGATSDQAQGTELIWSQLTWIGKTCQLDKTKDTLETVHSPPTSSNRR